VIKLAGILSQIMERKGKEREGKGREGKKKKERKKEGTR
jgi:hypothetical protein